MVDEEDILHQGSSELPPVITEKPSTKPFIFMGVVVLLVFLGVGVVFLQHSKNLKPDQNLNTVATAKNENDSGQKEVEDNTEEESEPQTNIVVEETVQEESVKEKLIQEEKEKEKEEKKKKSTYKYVKDDISWKDAKKAAKEAGGHLATITSKAEYKKVAKIASDSGLTFLWLGARVESEESWADAQWITGEDWTFKKWYPGEPSYEDEDGTEELYLCFWNVKHNGENIGWTFNDQRNDIAGAFKEFRGKIGYIIEFEE